MSLNSTSADIAEAIAQSKKIADQEWLADYMIGFLKSPSWVTPVMEYIDQHCIIFDSEDENKLEYTIKHNEFRALIDGLLAAHLLEVSISPEDFDELLQVGLANKSLHHILVEQLLSVDDFLTFKAMMVKRNKSLQMQALQQLEKKQQEALQKVAAGVAETAVSVEAQPMLDAQDDSVLTVCDETVFDEAEEVLSPTSGPGQAADWSMYEEEDQLISEALRISKEAAISSSVRDFRIEEEQAELEMAMALSMQLEEERLKREQVTKEAALLEMTPDDSGASCSGAATEIAQSTPAVEKAASEAAPEPEHTTVQDVSSLTSPTAAPTSLQEKQVQAVEPDRPKPEKAMPISLPRMVTLAPVVPPVRKMPMKNVTIDKLYEGGTSGPMPVKANVVDMKSNQPVAKPVAPAPVLPISIAARIPTPQKPTSEEIRQRTEHLKKQRELLAQKKTQEREQKLHKFQKLGGNRGLDKVESMNASKVDSKELIAQLTAKVEPDVASQSSSKEAARASQMRQALTAKLKQSLYQSLGTA